MIKITLTMLISEEKLDDNGNRALDAENKIVLETKTVSADFYLPENDRLICFERTVKLSDGKKQKVTVLEFAGSVFNVEESKKQVADLIKKARKE